MALIAWGPISWLYDQFGRPVVSLWIEKWAERQGIGDGPPVMNAPFWNFAADYAVPALEYITGPFGLGICAGALLASIPEIPALLRRIASRGRPLPTIDDGLLRDLQGFLETWLRDSCQGLKSAASMIVHDARLSNAHQIGFVRRVTQDALSSGLLSDYQKAQIDLSAAVESGSLSRAQDVIKVLLLSYLNARKYIGVLGEHLNINLNGHLAVTEWLEVDRECVMRLRQLTTSPRLGALKSLARSVEPAATSTYWRDGF